MPDFNMLPPIGPGQQAQAPQSLLQMAQDAMGQDGAPSGGQNPWAPAWVYDDLNRINAGAVGGSPTWQQRGFGSGEGQLSADLNPDNWGPPPPYVSGGGNGGWFTEMPRSGDPSNEKFWTTAAYSAQGPGSLGYDPNGPGGYMGSDTKPNTRNWRMLLGLPKSAQSVPAGVPGSVGDFEYLGNYISAPKLYYDTHRPISDPPTAGSFLPAHGSNEGGGWSTTGEFGFPGQLSPFTTRWGAGGPGG